jgi:uncharacterized protein YutE (UPF0331/DUF86 family)
MDTDPILTRLHKLDDNYLDIDSSLVYEHLTHRLDDFEAFARAILRFVEGG